MDFNEIRDASSLDRHSELGMLTSLDRDESRKKFSGSRKKFLDEKVTLEQMWALKCLRMRRDVFVLCRLLMPAASPPVTLLVSDYPSRPIPYL